MTLREKYEKELKEEYKSMYNNIKCNSDFSWER